MLKRTQIPLLFFVVGVLFIGSSLVEVAKSSDTLKSEIITAITNYNTNTLQKFDSIYRHSKLTGLIDSVDTSILSNITNVKIRKSFTPSLASSQKYNIYFRNAVFNPHTGHNMAAGGILSSTGFKVTGSDLEQFLDDDGSGNVRRYYLASGIRTYSNETQGTINYSNGEITLNSLNVASISNIRAATSTEIELTVTPDSNDIVPVRDQIVELDVANSGITVTADTFVGGRRLRPPGPSSGGSSAVSRAGTSTRWALFSLQCYAAPHYCATP